MRYYELNVKIAGLTLEQAVTLKSFLWNLEYAGRVGTSRYFAYMADGDGNFRPKIIIADEVPNVKYKPTDEIKIFAHVFDQEHVEVNE
jgi:hypothetical protein